MNKNIILGSLGLLALTSFGANAQTLQNNGQHIYVSDQAILHVNGDLSNTGTIENKTGDIKEGGNMTVVGDFSNQNQYSSELGNLIVSGSVVNAPTAKIVNDHENGQIVVAGDWLNQGGYEGEGWIELNGDDQLVSNSGIDIAQLQTSGAGNKNIEGDLRITRTFQLDAGVFFTGESNKMILGIDSEVIESLDGTSFVDGKLYHEIRTEEMYFPLGKNGRYLPASTIEVTGSTGTLLALEAFDSNPDPKNGLNIDDVVETSRWEKTVEGKLESGKITISFSSEEGMTNPKGLKGIVVAEAREVGTEFRSMGYSVQAEDLYESFVTSAKHFDTELAFNVYAVGLDYSDKDPFYIPNALTPLANDSEDQSARIYSQFMTEKEFSFIVYDRWGNKVFESNSIEYMRNTGWKGENQATKSDALADTYDYVLIGELENGRQISGKGVITVLR
ncbi:T9SS type B sorting domain-containing protein [Aureibacter tunicatorum]|uniref:Gliding motility-associated C-terminal domain-containing protein n=1 Tax=Aureibacter tunicatorum TaxID=866807 RepID=A0AAE4BVE3_9BACT|nr:gliding motility-associated C-terminal domain-containing protein [Aureibacter tunicatorum]MDR6242005.1 hypothetical protein [Aureibacter tunicatorum]BDD07262.1 hypothetical protein AUTU_47450 [Aureibacter tunicatorum]